MGFGYLLIGYLISYVLSLTVSGLGFGGLALLLGYAVMLMGLRELEHFEPMFAWSKWLLIPMAAFAVFDTATALDKLFLWQLPIFSEAIVSICNIASFALSMIFHFALLSAIRTISTSVGIASMAVSAVRNTVFIGMYAVVTCVANLPLELSEDVTNILSFAALLLNIVWVACNLLLLLACNKNICRKGDEEQTPRRSRLKWFNKIDDIYEKNKQNTIDSTREYAEEVLRRRQAEREKKKKRKK